MAVLNEIQINKLVDEMCDVLDHYEWSHTDTGVRKIVLAWAEAKELLIEMLRKHPNWNEEKLMVTLSYDYERKLDVNKIQDVRNMLWNIRDNCRKVDPAYLKEKEMNWYEKYQELKTIIRLLSGDYFSYTFHIDSIDGYSKMDIPVLKEKLFEIKRRLNTFNNMSMYTKESESLYCALDDLDTFLCHINGTSENDYSNIINDGIAYRINNICENRGYKTRAVVGQKIMKCLRKVMIEMGLDQTAEWNQIIALLGDGLNPLHYTRHTILSVNPIDNLRSSMGTSWSSCHTIDRNNVDGRDGDHYNGMHAKGNLSYMLDSVTAVFYTVHKEYDGVDFELQDKVTRMLCHIGDVENPFFIQGRVYPQSNDYEGETLYKEYRSIVQSILSTCWEVPNSWQTPIASEDHSSFFYSEGSHYRDYTSFGTCKISRLSGHSDFKRITIGHQELCVECGRNHYGNNDELSCCSNFDGYVECAYCGYEMHRDDANEINGSYYCTDCSFYCEYHGEYEVGCESDNYYISGYGSVCEDAVHYSGDFAYCERCGDYHRIDDMVFVDDYYYCDEDCAERDGWININGDWYNEDDTVTCEECGEVIPKEKAVCIDGGNYCQDCAKEIEETA